MLGEQLIKSDRIALVELIKNSYDADATRVEVNFVNFGPNYETTEYSTITITDDGSGMATSTLRDAWMNPATPSKLDRKRSDPRTRLGRVLQGEKGIGRFAVFKLGSRVLLTTRAAGEDLENSLVVDIAAYDDASPGLTGRAPSAAFLDEVPAVLSVDEPKVFKGSAPSERSGTRIEVSGLRSPWDLEKVHEAFADLERLQPLMWNVAETGSSQLDFEVRFFRDGEDLNLNGRREDEFRSILARAVLHVTGGRFDADEREFTFALNGRDVTLDADGSELRGLRPFRDRFGIADPSPTFSCGSFGFEFYIFDFSAGAPAQYHLDRDEKEILKQHRVYLYRDGVRVYPYGDPDDDWLRIDAMRGTLSARSIFSNDQTVGFVAISQRENPDLRDKTNREGLLDIGRATGDFVALIQSVLMYLRSKPYEQYAATNRRARERTLQDRSGVDSQISTIRARDLPAGLAGELERLEAALASERELHTLRMSRTQDLAGVGLSVETASHDLIAAGSEALRIAKLVVAELRSMSLTKEHVFTLATGLVQRLEFVDGRFQDVQGLFVSTRQRHGPTDVLRLARRVKSIYSAMHRDKGIEFEIDESTKLVARSTEAAVLQCLINLVDNSTFWLMSSAHEQRTIRVFVASPGVLAVTDSGPGVNESDAPFIFESFYSGKGEAGKGLGLYIAREVGLRNGFRVELAEMTDPRVLEGATFVISFDELEG
jgi:signal transduction histidine kinase